MDSRSDDDGRQGVLHGLLGLLYRHYHRLPHRAVNRVALPLVRTTRPRWLIRHFIRMWISAGAIPIAEFEQQDYGSIEDFFLRRVRPGARPLDCGFVAPADGQLVGAGRVAAGTMLVVKGRPTDLDSLLGQRPPLVQLSSSGHGQPDAVTPQPPPMDSTAFKGGCWATIYLSPHSYHWVHMPLDGEVLDARWIPGRFFPQNALARRHIAGIYEQNERVVLRCRSDRGSPFVLVLVGASIVGGIELTLCRRADRARDETTPIGLRLAKGDPLGYFTFGSTVVALVCPGWALALPTEAGSGTLLMGHTLFVREEDDQTHDA